MIIKLLKNQKLINENDEYYIGETLNDIPHGKGCIL